MPSTWLQEIHQFDQRPSPTVQAEDQHLLNLASLDYIGQRRRVGRRLVPLRTVSKHMGDRPWCGSGPPNCQNDVTKPAAA